MNVCTRIHDDTQEMNSENTGDLLTSPLVLIFRILYEMPGGWSFMKPGTDFHVPLKTKME